VVEHALFGRGAFLRHDAPPPSGVVPLPPSEAAATRYGYLINELTSRGALTVGRICALVELALRFDTFYAGDVMSGTLLALARIAAKVHGVVTQLLERADAAESQDGRFLRVMEPHALQVTRGSPTPLPRPPSTPPCTALPPPFPQSSYLQLNVPSTLPLPPPSSAALAPPHPSSAAPRLVCALHRTRYAASARCSGSGCPRRSRPGSPT
jgi:hypothetical protein